MSIGEKPVWKYRRFPNVESDVGYWARGVVPEMEEDMAKIGTQSDLGKIDGAAALGGDEEIWPHGCWVM